MSELILEKLTKRCIAQSQPRYGRPSPYPVHCPAGHLIMLTDENASSDGDIVCYSFKRLGLGLLIGKRTWYARWQRPVRPRQRRSHCTRVRAGAACWAWP